MAKALVLSDETLAAPVEQPRAAQPIKTEPPAAPKAAKPPKFRRLHRCRCKFGLEPTTRRRSNAPRSKPIKPSANSCLHAFMPA